MPSRCACPAVVCPGAGMAGRVGRGSAAAVETLGSRTRSAASPVGYGKVVRPSAADSKSTTFGVGLGRRCSPLTSAPTRPSLVLRVLTGRSVSVAAPARGIELPVYGLPRRGDRSGSTATTTTPFCQRPQIRRDNPLNLSISVSGGKETNQDSLSSGERRGKSPAPNPCPTPRAREMWRTEDRFPGCGGEPKSL